MPPLLPLLKSTAKLPQWFTDRVYNQMLLSLVALLKKAIHKTFCLSKR
jgi:hypothetical protein